MLHAWKRVVLSSSALALMLAIGAPIHADDDEDDGPDTIVEKVSKDVVKITHIIRKAKQGGGTTSTPDPGYSLTGWTWSVPVNYLVYENTMAAAGLDVAVAKKSLDDSFITWTLVANTKLPLVTSKGVTDPVPSTFARFSNGVNEIAWKNVGGKRTIAVTYTWAQGGVAKEFDMAFNTSFPWSTSDVGVAGTMDVQNIATHEAGHVFGLGHSTASSELTMYPYANYAETIRRTLEDGDKAGIQTIYPAP